jgi:hypothetical protein
MGGVVVRLHAFCMEVNGQLHVLAALFIRKRLLGTH